MYLQTDKLKQFNFKMPVNDLKEKYPIGKEFMSNFIRYRVIGIYQGPLYPNSDKVESSFFAHELV